MSDSVNTAASLLRVFGHCATKIRVEIFGIPREDFEELCQELKVEPKELQKVPGVLILEETLAGNVTLTATHRKGDEGD